jgi:hypothetical protein
MWHALGKPATFVDCFELSPNKIEELQALKAEREAAAAAEAATAEAAQEINGG